ncbi:MAG: hypothetical protein ACREQF_05695 [Candidatus Binataceae bacterium]
MASLEEIESRLKSLMGAAVERWDAGEIGRLSALAKALGRMKDERDALENALRHPAEDAERRAPQNASGAAELEITGGDIRQRLMRLTQLRRAGFDLPNGKELMIEAVTPAGSVRFQTTVAEPPRLRARREVANFYKAAGVQPGDKVLFEHVESNLCRISKVRPELRKVRPFDLEFLSGLERMLSEWNSESDEEAYGDL